MSNRPVWTELESEEQILRKVYILEHLKRNSALNFQYVYKQSKACFVNGSAALTFR